MWHGLTVDLENNSSTCIVQVDERKNRHNVIVDLDYVSCFQGNVENADYFGHPIQVLYLAACKNDKVRFQESSEAIE